jgi:chromosome segregation ATPase
METTTPPPQRISIDSDIAIGFIDKKAVKQFERLCKKHQHLIYQLLRDGLTPNKWEPYSGGCFRGMTLYHTHINDNCMFNWTIRDRKAAILYIGQHKDTEQHAEKISKSGIDTLRCVTLDEFLQSHPAPMIDEALPSLPHADLTEAPAMMEPTYENESETEQSTEGADVLASLEMFIQKHAIQVSDSAAERFEQRCDKLLSDVLALQQNFDDTTKTCEDTNTGVEKLKTQVEDFATTVHGFRAKVIAAETAQKAATEAADKLTKQLATLSTSLQEQQKSTAQVASTLTTQQSTVTRLEQTTKDHAAILAALPDVQRTLISLQNDITHVQAQHSSVLDKHTTLESTVQQAQQSGTARFVQLQSEVQSADAQHRAEVQALRGELQTKQQRVEALQREQAELTAKLAESDKAHKALKTQLDAGREELKAWMLQQEARLSATETKTEQLSTTLERQKKKGFFARLFG